MNAAQLLEQLQDLAADLEGQGHDLSMVQVRLAIQPAYPFEYSVKDEGFFHFSDDGEPCFFLAEGTQLNYLGNDVAYHAWTGKF